MEVSGADSHWNGGYEKSEASPRGTKARGEKSVSC